MKQTRANTTTRSAQPPSAPSLSLASDIEVPEARQTLISIEAYRLAEARGFAPGCELDDWLTAEAAIDAKVRDAWIGKRPAGN